MKRCDLCRKKRCLVGKKVIFVDKISTLGPQNKRRRGGGFGEKEGIVVASEGAKALDGTVSCCWLLRFINIPLFFQKEGGESENQRS